MFIACAQAFQSNLDLGIQLRVTPHSYSESVLKVNNLYFENKGRVFVGINTISDKLITLHMPFSEPSALNVHAKEQVPLYSYRAIRTVECFD